MQLQYAAHRGWAADSQFFEPDRQSCLDPNSVLSARLSLPEKQYATDAKAIAFWDEFLPRLSAIPQVAVGLTDMTFPFPTEMIGAATWKSKAVHWVRINQAHT